MQPEITQNVGKNTYSVITRKGGICSFNRYQPRETKHPRNKKSDLSSVNC